MAEWLTRLLSTFLGSNLGPNTSYILFVVFLRPKQMPGWKLKLNNYVPVISTSFLIHCLSQS